MRENRKKGRGMGGREEGEREEEREGGEKERGRRGRKKKEPGVEAQGQTEVVFSSSPGHSHWGCG